jgi:hypothetical protein
MDALQAFDRPLDERPCAESHRPGDRARRTVEATWPVGAPPVVQRAIACYRPIMRLTPLYTLRFRYPEEGLGAIIAGDEQEIFLLAEGRAEGGIVGRFRGANHPRRRADRTFRMNLQGAIETDDGAQLVLDYQGYGRSYPVGRRQVVGAAWHFCDHERYRRLNDSVCVIVGEVRRPSPEAAQADVELVFEVAELIWEPLTS